MENVKKYNSKFKYQGVLVILLVFAFIAVLLFTERVGIQFRYQNQALSLMPSDKIVTKAEAYAVQQKNCLLLRDSGNASSNELYEEISVIFTDMKVGFHEVDLSEESMPALSSYQTVVLVISDLSVLGETVITLCDWVYDGGRVYCPMTFDKNAYFSLIEQKLGILSSSYEYTVVDSIYLVDGFMVGGGKGYAIDDAYESGLALQLRQDDTVEVFAYMDNENKMPLIWRTTYGSGHFVVNNFGIYEKSMRGFFSASYSLLEDISVYPVINGSVFYLDDFPSQIPSGDNTYIKRDYGTSIYDFYVNIWWQDMMNIADQYGIKYTGLAIESYDEHVDGTTDAESDKETFISFGNMLLRMGGEIGYHGYNHQPLCFDNCDYKGIYDYKTWDSINAMKNAFDHLVDFCEELFPEIQMQIYVPPSNLLSDEGKEFLLKEYPEIKTISGTYFAEANLDFACTQEFEVSKTGVVDQPRVIAGFLGDSFTELVAVSELNMHYINSHFTHPDDALDPERGAELGWETLIDNFDDYLSWLYGSAKELRNFTGTEMSAAIQRYVALTVEKELTETEMVIRLGNFYEDAQLFVRFNEKQPMNIEGGTLTQLVGDLYLLDADDATITIALH